MTWDAIGAIGEVVGALAVIISIIYLAGQVRHNNKLAERDSQQSVLHSELDLASVILNHADIWNRALAGETFPEGTERRKAIVLFNVLMLINSNRYYQHKMGYSEQDTWSGREAALPQLVRLPIFKDWRESLSARGYTKEFLDLIDGFHTKAMEEDA